MGVVTGCEACTIEGPACSPSTQDWLNFHRARDPERESTLDVEYAEVAEKAWDEGFMRANRLVNCRMCRGTTVPKINPYTA